MVHNLFYVLLDSVCWYIIEAFCICIHTGYWFVVFFSPHAVFFWFWYQGNPGFMRGVGKCLDEFVKDRCYSSLNI